MKISWSELKAPFFEVKDVPARPGVFLLWVHVGQEEWQCFYAGWAEDLSEELEDQLNENFSEPCVFAILNAYTCGYMYAEISEIEKGQGIEKFLYETYHPRCMEAPMYDGEVFSVNLPS